MYIYTSNIYNLRHVRAIYKLFANSNYLYNVHAYVHIFIYSSAHNISSALLGMRKTKRFFCFRILRYRQIFAYRNCIIFLYVLLTKLRRLEK